ncbi:uncharacterized protein KQ657_003110 [Scheffersomyces spartinae]|uniref:Uncharacterized protein n=1 Tax=Scheffersomyces spartinae TaxID=45513 RepID=A0A9P8AGK9_9ASCO|nr:uncharacterized protein KQ657_003110 [Scheffersomyces spartinae]KAG7191515.1 hypothetical protein KQ657_003110 [Scheffersomyces spartinae]
MANSTMQFSLLLLAVFSVVAQATFINWWDYSYSFNLVNGWDSGLNPKNCYDNVLTNTLFFSCTADLEVTSLWGKACQKTKYPHTKSLTTSTVGWWKTSWYTWCPIPSTATPPCPPPTTSVPVKCCNYWGLCTTKTTKATKCTTTKTTTGCVNTYTWWEPCKDSSTAVPSSTPCTTSTTSTTPSSTPCTTSTTSTTPTSSPCTTSSTKTSTPCTTSTTPTSTPCVTAPPQVTTGVLS